MFDLENQRFIDLREVARLCSRNGRPLSPSTIWRWITEGRGPLKVRLQTWRIGGRVLTTRQALDAFLSALNQSRASPAPVPSPAARRRAAERAARELEQMGV
jgi:predicted DNA-binding transcriptional regulator AlpA